MEHISVNKEFQSISQSTNQSLNQSIKTFTFKGNLKVGGVIFGDVSFSYPTGCQEPQKIYRENQLYQILFCFLYFFPRWLGSWLISCYLFPLCGLSGLSVIVLVKIHFLRDLKKGVVLTFWVFSGMNMGFAEPRIPNSANSPSFDHWSSSLISPLPNDMNIGT